MEKSKIRNWLVNCILHNVNRIQRKLSKFFNSRFRMLTKHWCAVHVILIGDMKQEGFILLRHVTLAIIINFRRVLWNARHSETRDCSFASRYPNMIHLFSFSLLWPAPWQRDNYPFLFTSIGFLAADVDADGKFCAIFLFPLLRKCL